MISVSIDVQGMRELHSALTPLRFSRAINKAMRTIGQSVTKEYEATTATWRDKVEFITVYNLQPKKDVAEFAIGTSNKIFHMVDKGTPPHKIRPKNAKMLRFPREGTPKTSPGALGSVEGSYSDEFVYAEEVLHPGAEARNFTDSIMEIAFDGMDDTVINELELAWARQNS
jgi:hypothetical protein